MDISTLLFGFIGLLGLILYICNKRSSKYPPGPFGLPYVGSFFSMDPATHLTFSKWAKTYGPIFSVKLGEVNAVVLNDAKLIKEAFKEEAFCGRTNNKFFLAFTGGAKEGLLASDGQHWVEQRRFAQRGMKDFGLGKLCNTEHVIMEEIDELIERLKAETAAEKQQPIAINRRFSLAILNTMLMITIGLRFKQNDPFLNKLFVTFSESFNASFKAGWLLYFHKLCMWAPKVMGWTQIVSNMKETHDIIQMGIQEHVSSFSPSGPPRDFVDMYLTNMANTTDSNSSFYPDPGIYKQLKAVLVDFFVAGSETTAATLSWSILYLATHPHVQKKLQDELDAIVGVNRKVSLADRASLPYTEAVINEVLRLSTIAPTGLFHNTTTDVSFGPFEIPKNTYVIANLYGVNHDPACWEYPNEFRPERFLSSDGRSILKPESFIPFSAGKRACIGETLARNEVFLFMTNIFQRFDISPDRQIRDVSLEPELGFILQPQAFSVLLKDRLS